MAAYIGDNWTEWNISGGDFFTENIAQRGVAEKVIAAILLIMIIVLSVVGNIAVIIAVMRTPRLREKTSNIFLINLSVTDLMNATLVMPSTVFSLIADKWMFGPFLCYAQCAFNYWFIIVSMLTLAMISIDGYYAVVHPLHYMNIVTPTLTKMAVSYAWIQGFAFGLIPVIYNWVVFDYWEVVCAINWDAYSQEGALSYVITAFIFCFLIPAIVMTLCYTKICRVAKEKSVVPEIAASGPKGRRKNKKATNERRVIQSLALVVGIFFLCMTPFCVTKLIKIFKSSSFLPPYLYLIASWFEYLASATNPFIYAIFRRDFRRAFKHLFCRNRIFPGRNQSSSPNGTLSISESRRRRTSHSAIHNLRPLANGNGTGGSRRFSSQQATGKPGCTIPKDIHTNSDVTV
ncbi:alpha-2Db adrenergic receptor-like [Asterias rubens]|uniref:alpha-2Db adrenergic receptor-like n=1 Tax=Asterias rubens TaxID=7604 RepID=UPI0014552A18|nr:alpha-2Db adrenergic receptor-like [Asterias rubens]